MQNLKAEVLLDTVVKHVLQPRKYRATKGSITCPGWRCTLWILEIHISCLGYGDTADFQRYFQEVDIEYFQCYRITKLMFHIES
jgi:hypothetical protein